MFKRLFAVALFFTTCLANAASWVVLEKDDLYRLDQLVTDRSSLLYLFLNKEKIFRSDNGAEFKLGSPSVQSWIQSKVEPGELPNSMLCYSVLIDNSRSMREYTSQIRSDLDSLSNEFSKKNLKSNYAVFSDSALSFPAHALSEPSQHYKINDNSSLTQLLYVLTEEVSKLENCDGLVKHIILLSDGDAEDSSFAYTADTVIKHALSKGVSITSIAYGSRKSAKHKILARLSNESYGRFFHSSDELKFNKLQKLFKAQALYWKIEFSKSDLPFNTSELVVKLFSDLEGFGESSTSVNCDGGDKDCFEIAIDAKQTRTLGHFINTGWHYYRLQSVLALLSFILFLSLLIKKSRRRSREAKALLDVQGEINTRISSVEDELLEGQRSLLEELKLLGITDEQMAQHENSRVVAYLALPEGKGGFNVYDRANSIGYDTNCDIQIDDPAVSWMHACILYESGDFWWIDNQPTNATKVNGVGVEQRMKLIDHSRILCGFTEFNFYINGGD